ncbi:hypothetical protein ACET3Z_014111 [Daucus carota]
MPRNTAEERKERVLQWNLQRLYFVLLPKETIPTQLQTSKRLLNSASLCVYTHIHTLYITQQSCPLHNRRWWIHQLQILN